MSPPAGAAVPAPPAGAAFVAAPAGLLFVALEPIELLAPGAAAPPGLEVPLVEAEVALEVAVAAVLDPFDALGRRGAPAPAPAPVPVPAAPGPAGPDALATGTAAGPPVGGLPPCRPACMATVDPRLHYFVWPSLAALRCWLGQPVTPSTAEGEEQSKEGEETRGKRVIGILTGRQSSACWTCTQWTEHEEQPKAASSIRLT